ncbi:unnamed protein product [Phaeothamnion confervicola]
MYAVHRRVEESLGSAPAVCGISACTHGGCSAAARISVSFFAFLLSFISAVVAEPSCKARRVNDVCFGRTCALSPQKAANGSVSGNASLRFHAACRIIVDNMPVLLHCCTLSPVQEFDSSKR